MIISGKKIKLRPAAKSDRKNIFLWLTQSDLTPSMMGAPNYSDNPIPSLKEFCNDYKPHFFNSSGDGKGRNYIIIANNKEVGTIGYDLLDKKKSRVVLDIWLSAEKYYGLGYGSDALTTLCEYLHKDYGINNFLISPSARNKRDIVAFQKSGFQYISIINKKEQEKEFGISEYDDNVIMIKTISATDKNLYNKKAEIIKQLQLLRNIGPAIAERLYVVGVRKPEQVEKSNPEKLYEKLRINEGGKLDKCVLYGLRGAILDIPWWKCKTFRGRVH